MNRRRRPPHERVLDKIVKDEESGCWIFTGARNSCGHGSIRVWEGNKKHGRWVVRKAHRVVYEALVGPIKEGLVLRHSCDVRPCVNPDHLEPGTQGQNMREMMTRGRGVGQFACNDNEDPWE